METQFGENVETETELNLEKPKDYSVIFFNDDYTTKDFVVDVLVRFFYKTETEANVLMEKIHKTGSSVVGTYTYDIAFTKMSLTIQYARQNGFPLQCELQEV